MTRDKLEGCEGSLIFSKKENMLTKAEMCYMASPQP